MVIFMLIAIIFSLSRYIILKKSIIIRWLKIWVTEKTSQRSKKRETKNVVLCRKTKRRPVIAWENRERYRNSAKQKYSQICYLLSVIWVLLIWQCCSCAHYANHVISEVNFLLSGCVFWNIILIFRDYIAPYNDFIIHGKIN